MKPKITTRQIMMIALKACLSDVTVRNVYKGKAHPNSVERVKQAAEDLNIPLPEVEVTSDAQ